MSECQEATSKIEISPGDLGHLRVLRKFLDNLTEAQEQLGSHPSFDDPKRKLRLSDYLGLMLLGLLNPVAGTLRGMSAASRIRKIQKDVCRRPASLGCLSEAQGLVDVALLEKVFSDISAEAMAGHRVTLGEDARRVFKWMAHDGSIIPALDRMTWALYGGGRDGSTRAVRLHLSLDIASDCPVAASVTEGKTCERGQLRLDLEPGGAYILDRLYGQQHKSPRCSSRCKLGRRPSKRVWELYGWHQAGMIDDGELADLLLAQLESEKAARQRKAERAEKESAKKSS